VLASLDAVSITTSACHYTDEQSQQTNAFTCIQNLLELNDRFDSFLLHSFFNDKFFKQVISGDEVE
jgi:hypothetical protein